MATIKIGDKVRLTKDTRHGMVKAGAIGEVTEINESGFSAGVVVRFMKLPHPVVARAFGADPNKPEPFNCLFPKGRRLPLAVVS